MLLQLILLLTLVPIVELVILLQVHHAIASAWGAGTGLLVTLGAIAVTGIVGAILARHQGMGVLRELRKRMRHGELPGGTLVDGLLILIGASMLLTPGFLTDLVGFSLIIPFTRAGVRRLMGRWFQQKIQRGKMTVTMFTPNFRRDETDPPSGESKPGEPR